MGRSEEEGDQSVDIDVKTLPTGKADAALEFLRDEDIAVVTEVNEKALVRRIDWMIMPLMWAAYNLQYLDKVLSRSCAFLRMDLLLMLASSQLCISDGLTQ